MESRRIASRDEIEERFKSMADQLSRYQKIPDATYRLQFNHRFRFSDAASIVSYLHELGISDVYASPYFKAKKGSLHGYDILNPHELNPEVGTNEEYEKLISELKRYEMGQVLDIVPNHMSIASDENSWWMDVLENGPSSFYADFFDIDWEPIKEELRNKVLLPVLGDQYGRVLENQDIRLSFQGGAFFIHCYDRKFPVAPASYRKILAYRIEELEKRVGGGDARCQELFSVLTALSHLPSRTEKDPEKRMERRREKEVIKKRLESLYRTCGEVASFIDENIKIFNGSKDDPKSFDLLDDLLNDQAYRLSYWQVATEEINYRRFFDINELGSLRMEDPRVFEEVHRLVFQWIREGKVTGLRVDHPDGLYNPAEYFFWLQRNSFIQLCLRAMGEEAGPVVTDRLGQIYDEALSRDPSTPLRLPLYVVGEKILMKSERMPEDWPIFSTTGYVFLNAVNGIFIDMENEKPFDDLYRRLIGSRVDYPDLIYEKKKLIMRTSMPSEINMLGHYLNRISEKDRNTRDFTLNNLITAIVEVIAYFPVYRTYASPPGVNERDRRYIEQAVSRAKRKNPAMSPTVFDFLKEILLLQYPDTFEEADRLEWLDFAMRFQQMTGPIMAKGVEDTAFYVYNRFVSLNEVGGNPERFGTPLETFHGMNIERMKHWPQAMIATSTHDTKRGEDVRARLNVLSEIPDEWRESVIRWARINKKKKAVIDGRRVPDPNEEYLIYQTLIGAWPIHPARHPEDETFKGRIREYLLKAVREAKVNTSWISPDLAYEENLSRFVEAILASSEGNLFRQELERLHQKVSYFGMLNSLSQTLLKITSPGIPDFYQGTEIWDFSLVDPDNRRPIDFDLRKALLSDLKKRISQARGELSEVARNLLLNWQNGSPKLYVIYQALSFRRRYPLLFKEGNYIPLESEGNRRNHICAFARQKGENVALTVVPRLLTGLITGAASWPAAEEVWGESGLILPAEISGSEFLNVFAGEFIQSVPGNGHDLLPLRKVFENFPVALLEKVSGSSMEGRRSRGSSAGPDRKRRNNRNGRES